MSPAIEKELANLDKMRAEALDLEDVAAMAQEVADLFPGKVTVDITRWVAHKPFVNMRMDVNNFSEAIPVFRELAKRGWLTDKERPYDDYHELNRRTYHLGDWTGGTEWRNYRLRLMAFIVEGGECKRVQVGTREEPVYEWQCS